MFWIEPVLKGIGQGFLIGILSFGPAFITLIQSGIQGGKKAGFMMALGIFLSEFFVAMLFYFGLAGLFETFTFQLVFSAAAAISIFYIGFSWTRVNYEKFLSNLESPTKKHKGFFKGFYLNLINPFVLLLWGSVVAKIVGDYSGSDGHSKESSFINLVVILITLFALDIFKVFLSDYVGKKMNNKIYFYVNKYFGYILLLISCYFVYHFINILVHHS